MKAPHKTVWLLLIEEQAQDHNGKNIADEMREENFYRAPRG